MPKVSRRAIHVLIIDAYDEREMYAEAFRKHGLTVSTASTAAEGLTRFGQRQADVIVQGFVLPDMPGIELVTRLKVLAQMPIIVLSGFTDPSTLGAIYAAGADSVKLKPCLPDMLLGEVKRLFAARLRPRPRLRKLTP
jgi:two-component system KDP operon response regulator KdpE